MKSTPLLLLAILSLFFVGCSDDDQKMLIPDEAFSAYISAYTTGVVSTSSSIDIIFNEPVGGENYQETTPPDCFSTSPQLSGKLKWLNEYTLSFVPDEPMPSGKLYEADLKLSDLMNVPSEHAHFKFAFRTMQQHLTSQILSIGNYDDNNLSLVFISGVVRSSDAAISDLIERSFSASQAGKSLSIAWRHIDAQTHEFTIDSIVRAEKAGEIALVLNGAPLNSETNESYTQRIAGLSEFSVFQSYVVQQPEQHAVVVFSDPLESNQNLSGLIQINGIDFRTVINGNELKIYPTNRLNGQVDIEIFPGLINRAGYKSKDNLLLNFFFDSNKPEVRISQTQRTILPSSNGMSMSFEAVSLNEVTVKVIRVYQENVHQFLQVNDLNGNYELQRVARPVITKSVSLKGMAADLGKWNTFYLDLSDIIEVEQGAIYHCEITFSKKQAIYPCEDDEDTETEEANETWADDENEASWWDSVEGYYDYDWYYYDYDYTERENPCSKSYYHSGRKITFNVLSSDIALVAKKEMNGKWQAWATDIVNGNPLPGVELSFKNFQGSIITKSTSDAEGHISVDLGENVPYILQGAKNGQFAYLKLASGNSLNLSRFDIEGTATSEGMKGFIYGERGVWRPGDTLFLGFMLDPGTNVLPNGHPVKIQVFDARNKLIFKSTASGEKSGHYAWSVPTNMDAPTGLWHVYVKIGNASFSKSLRVETIKPNRLKIKLDLDSEEIQASDKEIKGQAEISWLHGAPADRLRTQIEMTLVKAKTTFASFSSFTFDDPSKEFYSNVIPLADQATDGSGKMNFSAKLPEYLDPPGKMQAILTTRAYEKGGDFSIDEISVGYSPYNSYCGLSLPKGDKERGMLLTDTTHNILVQSVNPDGEPLGGRKIRFELFKASWRWWWETSEDNTSSYAGSESFDLLSGGTITTDSKGKGQFPIKIHYPDWGRYFVKITDEESGHSAGNFVYIDWPGWAGRAQRDNPEGATMLTIASDKTSYATGDIAKITFPGCDNGRALITVEDGASVIQSEWVSVKAGSNTFNLPLSDNFTPNVYVQIMLIQPHKQTLNDAPIRMYGLLPIHVENPATRLVPVASVPKEIKPESEYNIAVSEESGRPMSYTLAVVDEGLLSLTRFKTPDPHAFFYAKEALGVQTFDLFDDIIGAYGADMKALLAIGGDESLSADAGKKANRFTPVVQFIGPFELKAGQKVNHKLKMGNYVGSVRVMVVAKNDHSYGSVAHEVPVRKPLMVLATLPRVLGPGEEVDLPVSVFAMDSKVKNVQVKTVVSKGLKISGEGSKTLSFSQIGEQTAVFKLRTNESTGIQKVQITASGGGETSTYEIEIDVRNPNPYVSNFMDATLASGESQTFDFDHVGMVGTNSNVLEISTFRPLNLGKRLDYLIQYPHGCAEQTTSAAFPQLLLSDAVELSKQQKERIANHVTSAIAKLERHQLTNGGFAYWHGNNYVNDWTTVYIADFLIEAKERGYSVNSEVLDLWCKYEASAAKAWRKNRNNQDYRGDILQPYRLLVLAKYGKAELSSMNRLREDQELSNQAKWMLAAAYHLAGKPEVSQKISTNLSYDPFVSKRNWYYGSRNRDLGLTVQSMVLSGKRKEAAKAAMELTDIVNSANIYNTQETAFMLIGVSTYLKAEPKGNAKYSFDLNGVASGDKTPSKAAAMHNLKISKQAGNKLVVRNIGSSTLYVRLKRSGQPVADEAIAEQNNLSVSITFTDTEGNSLDPKEIIQGTDVVIKIEASHASRVLNRINDLALSAIVPSGWEILNDRLLSSAIMKSSSVDFKDIRDDRVSHYFSLNQRETKTFYIRINATYIGTYYMPGILLEDMYNLENFARTSGMWVRVIEPSVL